ncbi:F0F1 ATP synthase subunit A [Paenibacillus sp. 481]|uniref:F0F1 ATP synthase subunit A n=1 Tax=Paenibacillus sp. 481 TaxID=2835869 RepID=UPI001E30BF70|nr:F0F1 ATP synthase subunit A [Paenibacillus sp. 481]UHA75658.1 F0F1 ATP synthase subunit A [Paenibacillus sp. 481]
MHGTPIIELFGLRFDLSVLIMLLVTCVTVFTIAKIATRNLSVENPGKMQNVLEMIAEFIRDMISSTMDWKKGKVYLSLGMTLIMFVFVANVLGLPFAIVTEHDRPGTFFGQEIVSTNDAAFEKAKAALEAKGKDPSEAHIGLLWWKSPTADASVSMGLAFMIFLLVHALGLFTNTKNYLKHYFQPSILFFPIHLMEVVAKLLTHGMRLFGNIFAGEVLISVLISAGAFAIPGLVVWQGFSIFVGTIQAFVFTILTMVYIGQSINTHEEH